MEIGAPQLIAWIIVGILAGTMTGMIAKGDRRGFGVLRNLGLGMTGALLGGLLFRIFRLFPNLDKFCSACRSAAEYQTRAATPESQRIAATSSRARRSAKRCAADT